MNRSFFFLAVTAPLMAVLGCQPGHSSQSGSLLGPESDLSPATTRPETLPATTRNSATLWVKGMG